MFLVFFTLLVMTVYSTHWTWRSPVTRRKISEQKSAVSVTQKRTPKAHRKIPAQYDKLRTLVDLANLALLFEVKAKILKDPKSGELIAVPTPEKLKILKDPKSGELIAVPTPEKVIKRVGRRMWKAAAEQFGWPTHGRICIPGFPEMSLHEPAEPGEHEEPAGFFEAEQEHLVDTVVSLDACLRLLVDKINAAHVGFFSMPSLRGLHEPLYSIFHEPLYSISSDHRLSIIDFSLHDLLAAALVSPPDTRLRDCIKLSRLKVCPICDKLYVAFRDDASACSPHCGSLERQRRYRSPEKQREYRRQLKMARDCQRAAQKSKPTSAAAAAPIRRV